MRETIEVRPLIQDDGPKLGVILLRWADSHRYWVFGFVAVLYLAGFSLHLRYSPDTAKHLLAGQALSAGGGDPAGHGADLTPGFPWLVAGFELVFGGQSTAALLVFMMAVGLLGVALVYRLFLVVVDRPTAVVMALVAGVNGVVYTNALRPMPDLVFYNGLLLALWGWHLLLGRRQAGGGDTDIDRKHSACWRGDLLLAAGLVLMALMRSVVLVVAAAMALEIACRLIAGRRWRWLAGLALGGVVCLALVHIVQAGFTLRLTPDEAMIRDRLIYQLPNTLHNAWTNTGPGLLHEYTPEALFGLNIKATAAPLTVLAIVGWAFLLRRQRLWGLVVLMFVVQWLLVGVTTRYFIPVVPLLGYGWWCMAVYLEKRIGAWPGTATMIVLLVLVPGGSVLKSGNTMLQQRSSPFYAHFADGKYEPLIELGEWMSAELPADALVIAGENGSAELSLISGRDARRYIRHAYGHDGPVFILTPLTQNARGHVEQGRVSMAEKVYEVGGADGRRYALYRLGRHTP